VETRSTKAAPNDHFASGPYCGVTNAWTRHRGTGSVQQRPVTRGRIVTAPVSVSAEIGGIVATPDDHFRACPYSRVSVSFRWRSVRGNNSPQFSGGFVPPPVLKAGPIRKPAPNQHLTARPGSTGISTRTRRHPARALLPHVSQLHYPQLSVTRRRQITI